MKALFLLILITLAGCVSVPKQQIASEIERIFNAFLNEEFTEQAGIQALSGWEMMFPSGRVVVRSFLQKQATPIIAYGHTAIPHLFKWLKIDNIPVRYIAIYSLGKITGIDGDIPVFATQEKAKPYIEKNILEWQKWYEAHSQDK